MEDTVKYKKDLEGNLYNLYLKKEIDQNNFQITYAKKGFFKEINNMPIKRSVNYGNALFINQNFL